MREVRPVYLAALILTIVLAACSSDSMEEQRRDHAQTVEQGRLQYLEGNYNGALETLQPVVGAISRTPEAVADSDQITTFFYVGNIHFAFNDYQQAEKYYQGALNKARKTGDGNRQIRFLVNLAYVGYHKKDPELTKKYYAMLDSVVTDDKTETEYYKRLLDAYNQLYFGKPDVGLEKLKGVTEFVDSTGKGERLKLSPILSIAETYANEEQLDSSLRYYIEYERLAEQYKLSNLMIDSKRGLMTVNTKLGDTEKALKYQQEYFALSDSLMSRDRYLRLNSELYDAMQRESNEKIENLEVRLSIQLLIILSIAILVLIGAIWMVFRNRERRNLVQLFKRNREIVRFENRMKEEDSATPSAELQTLYGRIVAYLDSTDAYCDPEFSLNTMADALESNTKYVSQAINEIGRRNFRSLVNEYRIKLARQRLHDNENYGNVKIQYLAQSVGFSSTATFYSVFKKITGLTPSMYQKLEKQDIE